MTASKGELKSRIKAELAAWGVTRAGKRRILEAFGWKREGTRWIRDPAKAAELAADAEKRERLHEHRMVRIAKAGKCGTQVDPS